MPKLTAKTTEYTYSIEEIKNMICANLDVPQEAVTVTFIQTDVSDDRYDRYPTYKVTGVKVTVDNTKIK
jgi:hypothetical protein